MNDEPKVKTRVVKYHKRSPIACDECKLRKKKCDGTRPCGSCTLYSKECTYVHTTRPSQKPTVRIRELEDTIRSVRGLLDQLKPNISGKTLSDVQQLLDVVKPASGLSSEPLSFSPLPQSNLTRASIESMLTGNDIVLQSGSRTFYHGAYSGPSMICAILDFFESQEVFYIHKYLIELFNLDETAIVNSTTRQNIDEHLPNRSDAASLIGIVVKQSHPFLQFLNPTLGLGLSDIIEYSYGNPAAMSIQDGPGSLALFHSILSLGYLIDTSLHHEAFCDTALLYASYHFTKAREILPLSETDTVTRLQVTLCMIVFLISTSRLSTAYSYIAIASTSAIKQGLHLLSKFDDPSTSERRQILTSLINVDLYVSTILGLPPMINIDTAGTTLETKSGALGLFGDQHLRHDFQTIANDVASKYCQIMSLTASVMWDLAATTSHLDDPPSIDAEILANAERDLRKWVSSIGIVMTPQSTVSTPALSPTDDGAYRIQTAKSHLELSFYHSHLLLYFPFIHYLRPLKTQSIPTHQSRPALACLKIAVNAITRCDALLQSSSSILTPSDFTAVYTIFLSVVALTFLIGIHEGTSHPSKAWSHADRGIRILAALRCHAHSPAERCLAVVKEMVRQLNYTVDFDILGIEQSTTRVCHRQYVGNGPTRRPSSRHAGGHGEGDEEFGGMSSADGMLAQAQIIRLSPENSGTENV